MARSAIVVGAGLGGLATALRLQHEGWQVTVLEKNQRVGGRCNLLCGDGFTFDTGPTLLLMRDVLDDLFRSVGADLDDYLDLLRVTPNYRVSFGDGSSVELSPDLDRTAAELERLERGAGAAFHRFLADAGYKYRVARERFVERNFPHWYNFATLANLYYLFATNTLRPLERHAGRYFRDPHIIAALTFQSMYLGLAPRDAPAVYSLLPYTELAEGIWFPRGGMYRVPQALRLLAEERGVRVETGVEVTGLAVRERRVEGVTLAGGGDVSADVVVCNADLPYAYDRFVPRNARSFGARRNLSYGSSAFLLYLGLDRSYPRLDHHGVFLARDVAANFDAIFRERRLPDDPSFYTCVPNRTDPTLSPPGRDALYVLVPVPALDAPIDWSREATPFRERVFDRLEASGLEDLRRHVTWEGRMTPVDLARDYNIAFGSAFGIAHTFRQVGYFRPANKAARLDNLYFVGAATVPGGGIPMVVIGSRLVAERIRQDCHAA